MTQNKMGEDAESDFAIPFVDENDYLSLIHISEPTRRTPISYAVFCLKKKKHESFFQKVRVAM